MGGSSGDTRDVDYTARLEREAGRWWKRAFDVQAPYRWNVRRLELGFTLDLGCGIGRNLLHLRGHGVGVDHNPHSVERARARGLRAYGPEEFCASGYARAGRFDSLLVAHVLEHATAAEASALVRDHLPFVRAGGKVVLVTPQEAGFRSDPTHVTFLDFAALGRLLAAHGVEPLRAFSFPFPRPVGRVFRHNEFVVVGRAPGVPPGAPPRGAGVTPGSPPRTPS